MSTSGPHPELLNANPMLSLKVLQMFHIFPGSNGYRFSDTSRLWCLDGFLRELLIAPLSLGLLPGLLLPIANARNKPWRLGSFLEACVDALALTLSCSSPSLQRE